MQYKGAGYSPQLSHVIPNRGYAALLDRITDHVHIVEIGTESYCFRRTLEATAFLRGRPPFRPLARELAALAWLRTRPPAAPSCEAIHRREPNTPCSKAGTCTSASSLGHRKIVGCSNRLG